ncbi:MAG: helix-turn-helix domain-containing protein [Lachnospiraceae bacterium]|nr:helix-turn-helix domain-containing protein [Lachnospiraceae bacterium]
MLDLYKNIKACRLQKKWSQDELAQRVGYSDKSMISKIEKGLVDLSQSQIIKFSEVFGVPASVLFGNGSAATPALSPDREELLANYDRLNDEGKQDAIKYVKLLGNSPEYTEDAEDTGNGNITA